MDSEATTHLHEILSTTSADEYLKSQRKCIDAFAADDEPLRVIAADETADLSLREEALQVVSWTAADSETSFFMDLSKTTTNEQIAKSCEALAYRLTVRQTVAKQQPDKLSVYLSQVQVQYAKWLFGE
jgi:hypothetical protein